MSVEKKLFNVEQFCKRHLNLKEWKSQSEQQVYTKSELFSLCDMVIELFKKESTLAKILPPVRIVGDIHGQYEDLVKLLNCRSTVKNDKEKKDSDSKDEKKSNYAFATKKWVFLGDYIDRSFNSLECICLVFSLRITFPKQYVLLRGNHETRVINFRYGFRHELLRRIPSKNDAIEIWEKFNEAFSWMPLACEVGTKILCMHGGISPELNSLNDIRNIERPLVDVGRSRLALDLLWADPEDFGKPGGPTFMHNRNRGLSVVFNAQAVYMACLQLKISVIVRAHQMMPHGFKFFANRKLCTVFSAPRYMNEVDNDGAVLKVSGEGKLSIIKMRKPRLNENKPICDDDVTKMPGKSEYASLLDIEAASKFSTD